MEKIEYNTGLIQESKVLHLSTQTTSCIPLNGAYKSKVAYDVRGYLNMDGDDSIEYVTVEMPYAVLTNSNYIVNENNNKLVVTWGGSTNTYTLILGNYTVSTFTALLYTYLPSASGWTITTNSTTNTYTFSLSTGAFSFLGTSTCDYIIGFSGTVSSVANTIIMSRTYCFLPIPRFIIHCNILNDGINLGTNSSVACSDVLASIPNTARNNGQVIYENNSGSFLVKNLNIGNIEISITDDNNRLINFLGISSYFQLKFTIFRRYIQKPMRFNQLADYINKTTNFE